jgi:hypothetical protein
MKARTILWLLGPLVLGTLLVFVRPGKTDEPPPQNPQGVEVLARGPVHEAFAEPVETRPQESPVVPRKPPDPVPELPPDQKPEGNNVQWIPGYWSWDDDSKDFLWVSGIWRDVPPGRQWVPGHWQQVEEGWQWVAGFWAAADQNQMDYVPPPPPSIDAGPSAPAPDATSSYTPGCWVYREARFWWRPGFWVAFRPDWMWVPAHYIWSPGGCLFVEGYWDHPLHERGLLFAPVRFERGFVVTVERPFVPSFVVQSDFLLSALFVSPTHHHYYFGDYFEERYAQRGFVTWLDYRTSKHSYDPTFAYYRHSTPDAEQWERSLHALYAGRRSGEVPRPPHTLVQQQQVVNTITVNKTHNTTVNKSINITNVQNVSVLAPLNQVQNTRVTNLAALGAPDGRKVDESKMRAVKLEAVPKEAREQEQKAAVQMREVAQRRREAEAKLLHEGAPVKPTDPPKPLKLDLPKAPPAPAATEKAKPALKPPPPPPPVVPKHEDKPIPQHEPPKPAKPPKPPGKDDKPPVQPKTETPEPAKQPPKEPPPPPKEPPPPPKEPPKPPPKEPPPPPKEVPKPPPPKEPPPKPPAPKPPDNKPPE